MDWTQVLTIVGANLVMCFWLRTEANADRRELSATMSSDRKELLQLIKNFEQENRDFHTRMAVLEERYLQILTQQKS